MKRAGFDLQQESSKKQRLDQQTEETEEEAEAQVKKGKISTYHITRANGSTRRYTSMINLLENIDREDLETLWKLVKDKYGNTRPEKGYERVLWGDLKVMFEPDIESEKVVEPSLFGAASSFTGGTDPITGVFSYLIGIDFFAEVRMRVEYNVTEKRRLKSAVESQGELLKAREEEIRSLKARLLLKEAEATKAIRLRAEASNFETVKKSLRDEVNALRERNIIGQFQEDPPKDPLEVSMTDNHTMAEMLRAPTEGYAEAIIVPSILAEQFELKHSLINMMTSEQFFGLEKDNPHDHIRCLRNEISNFEQKFDESFHEAWDRYKDLLRACPHHGFTELHQLNTFYNALNHKDQDSLNAAAGGNLLERSTQEVLTIIENKSKVRAHPYYQCLAISGNTFPELRDNIQGYVSAAAVQYNQGNPGYRPPGMANQTRPPGPAQQHQNVHLNELEKVKRMNEANMKAMQTQIDMVKNELRNEMKNSIQTSLINQTNEIKNMMASLLQTSTASTSGSGSLPSNTVANPKGELKAITTRSGLVIDGPTVPTLPTSINPKVDERVEETFTDPDLAEYTIKVLLPPVPKYKPPSQREFVVHQRDPLYPNISYPSRMLKQKQQEKDKVQIQNFWQMFKKLHVNITLADALILMPKYQKMLKALLSNKEKLQELENTPLNENYSAVILKKLPEKLGDPGKFLIPCGFSELKYKALANLGASINLMPLSVWKKLADFVIVDYESDPRVPLILGRPFLRTARALIDVHGEEMILRDVSNQQNGNPTLSLHQEFTSTRVTHEIHDSEGCNLLSEILPDIDAFNNIHPHFDDDPLSGSTTYSANSLLEEFTDELALITYPSDYDNLQSDIESDLKEIEFLLYQGKDSSLKDSSIQTDRANLDDYFVDPLPEMFTEEHAPDYSSPPKFNVYLDDFLENKSYANNFYDDPFNSEGEKIKESKLLMDELDLPCNSLPYSETDSFNSKDFSRVDDMSSPDNEDKVFNPGILNHEKIIYNHHSCCSGEEASNILRFSGV
nr:reverse transcriptase domain-containing protein [Tanacetum cinerariifolium]